MVKIVKILKALNLKEFGFKGIKSEADSLRKNMVQKDMELIKTFNMQKNILWERG